MNYLFTRLTSSVSEYTDLTDGSSIPSLIMSDAYEICSNATDKCGLGLTYWPGVPINLVNGLQKLIDVRPLIDIGLSYLTVCLLRSSN